MLRQYDSRLARWKTKDPMGQYASPYMAMGNNPVSFIDPSGGNDYYIDGLWVTEGTYNRLMGNSSFAGNIDRLESSDVVFGYNRGTGQYSQFGINNYITSSVDNTIGHYKNTHRGGAKGPKILEYGVDFTRTTFDLSGLYSDLGINPNYGGDGGNPDGDRTKTGNVKKNSGSYQGMLDGKYWEGCKSCHDADGAYNNLMDEAGWNDFGGSMFSIGLGYGINSVFSLSTKFGFSVNPSKFDYFFGKVTTGSAHNIARSAQNLKDLTKMGISSQSQLVNVFKQAFYSGKVISSKTTQYGVTVMKSVNVGNNGNIIVGFLYQGGNMNSVPSIITIIPKTW